MGRALPPLARGAAQAYLWRVARRYIGTACSFSCRRGRAGPLPLERFSSLPTGNTFAVGLPYTVSQHLSVKVSLARFQLTRGQGRRVSKSLDHYPRAERWRALRGNRRLPPSSSSGGVRTCFGRGCDHRQRGCDSLEDSRPRGRSPPSWRQRTPRCMRREGTDGVCRLVTDGQPFALDIRGHA